MGSTNLKVPVGTTSIAGYGATIIGIIGTVLVMAFDVDQEQAAVIAGAAFTIVSFAVTQAGRYVQARELAKTAAAAAPPADYGRVASGTTFAASPFADEDDDEHGDDDIPADRFADEPPQPDEGDGAQAPGGDR